MRNLTLCFAALLLLSACGLFAQNNATATSDILESIDPTAPKEDGVYLIGVQIARGKWGSAPGEAECIWFKRKASGQILEQYTGPSGDTLSLDPRDYEVEFIGCGTWTYLGVGMRD